MRTRKGLWLDALHNQRWLTMVLELGPRVVNVIPWIRWRLAVRRYHTAVWGVSNCDCGPQLECGDVAVTMRWSRLLFNSRPGMLLYNVLLSL